MQKLVFFCILTFSISYGQNIWPPPGTTRTGGWLSTTWHQDYPFNASCPYDSVNNGKSLVGCLGLAMAQIINYHGQSSKIIPFSAADDYQSSLNNFTLHIDHECASHGSPDW